MGKIECYFLGDKSEETYMKIMDIYLHRIQQFVNITCFFSSIKIKFSNNKILLKKEAEWVFNKIAPTDYLIICDERGKMLDNITLSKTVAHTLDYNKKMIICIGSAYGIDNGLKKRADLIWSLSTLILPHQIARLVVVEQIYRSLTILKNHPYHHS